MSKYGIMSYTQRKAFSNVLCNTIDLLYRNQPERLDMHYDLVDAWVRGEAHTLSDEEITSLEKLILRATGMD